MLSLPQPVSSWETQGSAERTNLGTECWWLLCSLGTQRCNSSAYHLLWAPLHPVQPLKMQRGSCSALVREGVRLTAPWCCCGLGRASEVPGQWREAEKDTAYACRLGRMVQNYDHHVGIDGTHPGTQTPPCLAWHSTPPHSFSLHTGWRAAVLIPSRHHEAPHSAGHASPGWGVLPH